MVLPFQETIVDDTLKLLPKIPTFCEYCKPTLVFSSWIKTQTNDSDDNCGVGSRTLMKLRLCLKFGVISCLNAIECAISDLSIIRIVVINLINYLRRSFFTSSLFLFIRIYCINFFMLNKNSWSENRLALRWNYQKYQHQSSLPHFFEG